MKKARIAGGAGCFTVSLRRKEEGALADTVRKERKKGVLAVTVSLTRKEEGVLLSLIHI